MPTLLCGQLPSEVCCYSNKIPNDHTNLKRLVSGSDSAIAEETMAEIVAYHEAGHAVVAHILGGKVQQITIDPDNDDGPARFGDTQVRWRRSIPEKQFSQNVVQVCLAGPVAEMIYSGDPYHPGLIPEWAADWNDAWNAAEQLYPNERQRLDYLEKVSIELYHRMHRDEFWNVVASVADGLLAYETLEHDEFVEIVSEWLD